VLPQRLQTRCGSNHASVTVSGNWSTLRMRVASHDLQNTSNERTFFALISPRVVMAPLPDCAHVSFEMEYHSTRSTALHREIYGLRFHSAVTATRYCSPMRSDDYHRLHVACLAIAKQSTEPDLRARWLAAADAWLKLATEQHERSRSVRGCSRNQALLP
jgi:hypothetical protein